MELTAAVRVERLDVGTGCRVSRFTRAGGATEVHLSVEPRADGTLDEQLAQVADLYHATLAELGLPRHTAVFRRVFVSDAANQIGAVMVSPLGRGVGLGEEAAVSCVEQAPMCVRKVSLFAWHIDDVRPEHKTVLPVPGAGEHARTTVVRRPERSLVFTTGMTGQSDLCGEDPVQQTRHLFHTYRDVLRWHHGRLLDHAVRTWLFVKDIDSHYAGMVQARRRLFLEEGLTPDSHYLVSTGIAGRTEDPTSLVCLDALALEGMAEGQLVYVDCLDHLNRTEDYGVTFERAARLDHGDRSHLFLAGTASIDARGRILHEGDVLGQVDRTLENIGALLERGGATADDLAWLTVYLRDGADARRVAELLEERVPGLPFNTVLAPVCRPGWLVEIEGVAVLARDDPRWPRF